MKKIFCFLLSFLLSLSVSAQAGMQEPPLAKSGYTEDGVYYEVHGGPLSQYNIYADSRYVRRDITYNGNITSQRQIPWEETVNGVTYTGTLTLVAYSYNRKENKTETTYEGSLTSK